MSLERAPRLLRGLPGVGVGVAADAEMASACSMRELASSFAYVIMILCQQRTLRSELRGTTYRLEPPLHLA